MTNKRTSYARSAAIPNRSSAFQKDFAKMTLKAVVQNMWLSIVLAPIAMFFIIFACLVAGPSEVFKALTNRK